MQPALANARPPQDARTLGYARVSTEQQAGETKTSLADQHVAIQKAADKAGRALDYVFVDAGASGATAEGRPQFMQLVAFCEANPRPKAQQGFVYALNDSRWGRFEDPEEAGYWRVRLARVGWRVRFAEGDDVDDRVGRMVLRAVGSAQASEYRENIRRNARRGRRSSVAAGYWMGPAPFGYRRAVVHPAGRERVLDTGVRKAIDERVKLVPGPDAEVEAVRWLFSEFARGARPLRQIRRDLNARLDVPLSYQAIRLMLKSRSYLGEVMTGRRTADGEQPDPSTWVIAEHAHEPLVTVDVFDRVQRRFGLNPSHTRSPFHHLLSGLVTCADCGTPIKAGGTLERAGKPRYHSYRCRNSNGTEDVACPGGGFSIAGFLIEPAVVEAVADVVALPSVQRAVERAFGRVAARRGASPARRRTELEQERRTLESKRDRLVNAIAEGTLTRGEAEARLTTIRAGIDRVTTAIEQQRFAAVSATPSDIERDRWLTAARDFRAISARASTPQLRQLIAPWIQAAVFDKTTRQLTLALRRVPLTTSAVDVPVTTPGTTAAKPPAARNS